MKIKKKLFIGSSSEELDFAKAAKSILEKDFDVTVWDENVWDKSVFRINEGFLDSLLRATLIYDFGLLIGTKDDKVKIRGKIKLQPRDNILFELGLFTGRLGTSRCAFLIEKRIKIPSDLLGITLAQFNRKDKSTFEKEVNKIKDHFLKSQDTDINFFPSTTLAAGYFENFIKPTCRHLINNDGFTFKDMHYKNYKISIIVPDKITEDVNLQLEQLKNRIKTENEQFKYEGRPRTVSIEIRAKDNILHIIDFPTNISGINYALSQLIPRDFNETTDDYSIILERELRRYVSTLKGLLVKNEFHEIVEIKREADFKISHLFE